MLIDLDTRRLISTVPFQSDFDLLRHRLTPDEFEEMVARINELIDEGGAEVATAG